MMRLNLSSDFVRNCEEATAFEKESSICCINKYFYLKNSNNSRSIEQVKLVKVLEKYPKLEVIMNIK